MQTPSPRFRDAIPADFKSSEKMLRSTTGIVESLREKLLSYRADALHQFETLGLPTKRLEAWRYADMAEALDRRAPSVSQAPAHSLPEHLRQLEAFSCVLVFIDGKYSPSNSRVSGLGFAEVGSLGAVWRGEFSGLEADQALGVLQRGQAIEPDGLSYLNQAFLHDGGVVHITESAQETEQIHIVHWATAARSSRHAANLIWLEKDSSATITESFGSDPDAQGLVSATTVVQVGEGAKLTLNRLQSQGPDIVHYGRVIGEQLPSSLLTGFVATLGGRLGRETWHVSQTGAGAVSRLYGATVLRGEAIADQRTVVRHLAPLGVSEQLYKSIVADRSHSGFTGKIYIAQDAQQVASSQLNHSLLVGEQAESNTRPELEVYADDVKANHGATVGQINSEELFYFASRGIDPQTATQLLGEGFVKDVLLHVPAGPSRDFVGRSLQNAVLRLAEKIEVEQ